MCRISACLALVTLLAVVGCEDKKAKMASDSGQDSSLAYQSPSNDYYGPASAGGSTYGYDSTSDPSASAATDSTGYATGGTTHVVAKGETLYSLARTYYNDQSKWKQIYDANRSAIPDPNRIKVGQQLVIP